MTRPTNRAIAQAFYESLQRFHHLTATQFRTWLLDRAREIDAAAPQGAQAAVLWCLHLQGPDEVHAAPSKEHAERAAAMVNERDDSGLVRAVAAPWPHTPDSHAEDVGRFITEWLLPRWQVEALSAAHNDRDQNHG